MAASRGADPPPAGLEFLETGKYADMELVICLKPSHASGSSGGGSGAARGTRGAKRQRGPPPPAPRVLHTVAAHRVVLAAQSAWAKAMLNNVQPAEVRRGWL